MATPPIVQSNGRNAIQQAINQLADMIGQGAALSGASIILWEAASTWAQVYALIQAAGGYAVVIVPNDSSKEMTPDPGGPTDLSNVFFVGIPDQDNNKPTVDIDSLGVGGFALGGNYSLHSKNINWQTYYRIVSGTPTTWEFDGGSLSSSTTDDCYRATSLILVLRNGAVINGTNCTDGQFVGLRNGALVIATGGCELLDKCFYGNVGVPPFPAIRIQTDGSTTVSPNVLGASTGINLVYTLMDRASLVSYDDSLTIPSSGQNEVQGMLDWLKTSVSPPGHMRVDLWRGGETWQDVYERFVENADGGILFVWWDGGTPRDITPNPAGATDLNNVFFVGLRQADGSLPIIRVDPANLGTFVLSAQGGLHSQDLRWEMPAYLICDASIYIETTLQFNGGSLVTVPGCVGLWKTQTLRLNLTNGAFFDGTNTAVGSSIVEVTSVGPNTSNLWVETLSKLGAKSVISAVASPLILNRDASAIIDPMSVLPGVVVTDLRMDKSPGVEYTPVAPINWVGPPPTNVADAIDRIAAKVAPIP